MKIALLGAKGFDVRTDEQILDCFPWDSLDRIGNLRDYDFLIINLWNGKPENVDWDVFKSKLDFDTMKEVLMPRGRIYILGDPRFSIQQTNKGDEAGAVPFLHWTGITFQWDDEAGDTVDIRSGHSNKQYETYLGELNKWDYSLRTAEVNEDAFWQFFDRKFFGEKGLYPDIESEYLASNRYGCALASRHHLVIRRRSSYGPSESVFEFGPTVLLPRTSRTEEAAITTILRDLCGVESEAPEPEWIKEFRAPGQRSIDESIGSLEARLRSALDEWETLQGQRESARDCLKLLYERGQALERAVRSVLREMSTKVEDPEDPGKEDGWIAIQIGDTVLEGVLEIKSTSSAQFGEDGIRQLLDWVGRGVNSRQKKYKGIFIGSNAIDKPLNERPWAFSDNWMKSAELHQFAALKSEDLFAAYVLIKESRLDPKDFWKAVFETDGVVDLSELFPADNSDAPQ